MTDQKKNASSESRNPRRHPRYLLQNPNLPGRLFLTENMLAIEALAVDVSKNGVGIRTGVFLKPGTKLLLKLTNQEIPLEVVWYQQRDSSFRLGLKLAELAIGLFDLEEIFFTHGNVDLDLKFDGY